MKGRVGEGVNEGIEWEERRVEELRKKKKQWDGRVEERRFLRMRKQRGGRGGMKGKRMNV